MPEIKDLVPYLEKLTGDKADLTKIEEQKIKVEVFKNDGIGYSQFNEILLLLGYDRVTREFFQFICDGKIVYDPGSTLEDIEMLDAGIEAFTRIALLFYGNIQYGYKRLSRNKTNLQQRVLDSSISNGIEFTSRHLPLKEVEPIDPTDTYYLGYYIEKELKKRLKKNKNDKEAIKLENRRIKIVQIGKKNDTAYLASDHLDVYVATSMRKPHEFFYVNKFVDTLTKYKELRDLKLRIFNPTMAYCKNRIDKGLSEALMLKRAKCTIYLAQESETLGKDSELACTLAQGKVVIAYVPFGDEGFVDDLLKNLSLFNPNAQESEIIIEQLQVYDASLAWSNKLVKKYLHDKSGVTTEELKDLLYKTVHKTYEDKASALRETHPLGIQVNLKSGVANGVLVARNMDDCANLVKESMLNSMEFTIVRNPKDNDGKVLENYIYLKENRTESIYRVMTGHEMLTNSFWNFYLGKLNSEHYV